VKFGQGLKGSVQWHHLQMLFACATSPSCLQMVELIEHVEVLALLTTGAAITL